MYVMIKVLYNLLIFFMIKDVLWLVANVSNDFCSITLKNIWHHLLMITIFIDVYYEESNDFEE